MKYWNIVTISRTNWMAMHLHVTCFICGRLQRDVYINVIEDKLHIAQWMDNKRAKAALPLLGETCKDTVR
jgi:hypothetical protein